MRSQITVPAYLQAKTKDELRKLMRAVQLKHGMKFHFFDIQYAEGKWVAWYEISLTQEVEKGAVTNG